MLLFFMAQPSQGASPESSAIQTFVMLGGIIVIFYFFMIRPQQKRAKEHKALLNSIQKGDNVVTSAGIRGVVHSVGEATVDVTIASGVHVTFDKSAVASVVRN
jgi:preprotein translocase subunit YajC